MGVAFCTFPASIVISFNPAKVMRTLRSACHIVNPPAPVARLSSFHAAGLERPLGVNVMERCRLVPVQWKREVIVRPRYGRAADGTAGSAT